MIKYKISDICNIIGGNPAPKGENIFGNEGLPFLKMKDLGRYHTTNNLVNIENKVSNENARKNNLKIIKKGAILLPRSGSVGLNHRAVLGLDAYMVSHICALVIKDFTKVNNIFLYYYLKTIDFKNITKKTTGLDALTFEDLGKIQIPLPPLPEQKRIADLLDRAESIRQKRKESIALLDEFLKSVFIDMFGDPVRNEKGWEVKKFSQVGTLERGRSKHRPRNAPHLLGGKYPLIQTGEIANSGGFIRSYTHTYSDLGLKQSKLWPKDTLCITIAANIGKTAILTFEACFPDSVVGFKPNKEMIKTEYVQYWISFIQNSLEDSAPQVAQKNINLEILRKLNIPVPPLNLQIQFSKIIKQVEQTKSKMEESLREMDNQFGALLQSAFKGGNLD
ncbi:MAG: restriction endonuclease subunit S [Ignavibacteria bacterium]